MLKLFRKIRHKLRLENKTSKPVSPIGPPDHGSRAGRYFKYDIGKIIKCPIRDLFIGSIKYKDSPLCL
ncbi:MAG: hypothetical protein IPL55_03475 [Saprospiraceae bacterium]|nr:hypothetical protein [Saprospiraceae bacterium]